jgi:hypothetical protein
MKEGKVNDIFSIEIMRYIHQNIHYLLGDKIATTNYYDEIQEVEDRYLL